MTTDARHRTPDPEAALLVERSIRKYRRAHRRYERRHPEIFNPVEQQRLHDELGRALRDVGTGADHPRVLDLGCGTGNLTRHLLEHGARVLACDVSPDFLQQVQRRFGAAGRVETMRLNGVDLRELPDGAVDMVCAYSVLHHIPDYLAAVDEIARVLAPGGVVYLDHEANHNFWDKESCFWELLRANTAAQLTRRNWWNGRNWWNPEQTWWQRYLQPSRYVLRIRQKFNPAYPWDVEGDIHVWDEDHIEWDRIEERLAAGGCEVTRRVDYLNYSSEYPKELWQRFHDGGCTNMRLTVAQRARTSSAQTDPAILAT